MGRGRAGVAAHPGVQTDVVVVSARGEEDRIVTVPLGHLEAENVPVEAKGPLDVRHLQVNVADACPGFTTSWFARPSPFLLLVLDLTPDSTAASESVYDQEECSTRKPARTPPAYPPTAIILSARSPTRS